MDGIIALGMVVCVAIAAIAINKSDAEVARQAIKALAGLLKR